MPMISSLPPDFAVQLPFCAFSYFFVAIPPLPSFRVFSVFGPPSTEIRELRHEINEMGKVLDRVLYKLQRQKENEVPRFVPLSSFRLAGLRLCGDYRTPGTRADFPCLTSRADAFSEE